MYKWSSLHRAVHRPLVLQHQHLLTKHKTNLFSSTTQNLQPLPDPTSISKTLPSEEQKEQERENAISTSSFSSWINRARSKASGWKKALIETSPRTSTSSSSSSATEKLDESHAIPIQQPASRVDSPDKQLLIRRTNERRTINQHDAFESAFHQMCTKERQMIGALKHSADTLLVLDERLEKMEATIQSLTEKLYSEVQERLQLEKNMIQFKLDSSKNLKKALIRRVAKEYVSNDLASKVKTDTTLVREGMVGGFTSGLWRSKSSSEMRQDGDYKASRHLRDFETSKHLRDFEAQWKKETKRTQTPPKTQTPRETQTPPKTQIPKETQAPRETPTPPKTHTPKETQAPRETQTPPKTQTPRETQTPKGDWESIRTAFHHSLSQQQNPRSLKITRIQYPL